MDRPPSAGGVEAPDLAFRSAASTAAEMQPFVDLMGRFEGGAGAAAPELTPPRPRVKWSLRRGWATVPRARRCTPPLPVRTARPCGISGRIWIASPARGCRLPPSWLGTTLPSWYPWWPQWRCTKDGLRGGGLPESRVGGGATTEAKAPPWAGRTAVNRSSRLTEGRPKWSPQCNLRRSCGEGR